MNLFDGRLNNHTKKDEVSDLLLEAANTLEAYAHSIQGTGTHFWPAPEMTERGRLFALARRLREKHAREKDHVLVPRELTTRMYAAMVEPAAYERARSADEIWTEIIAAAQEPGGSE